ncbi:ATP synthase subunit I [Pseudolysobacter antarcticus]|uniref:ATP synthase subunit I n=1 Tax=Pseudolysobacter antarcticus TaxID=2511995 RepID=A0A411HKZ0_9GAMM|nr:ATP synthase subunit I [Pseudolysobacter antarcticus]QBB71158.1 ATP synthase subunit I [Pseudolysobacter antarcticus]
MSDLLTWALVWSAGVALGAIFFGGLWWTVRRGVLSEHPAVWFLVSVMLRTSLVLGGFYVVADGQWPRLLLCLLGFVMAREGLTWLTRYSMRNLPRTTAENDHAA